MKIMRTVLASDFKKNFGLFKKIAQHEPITIISNEQDNVVLISATEYGEYQRIKKSQYAYDGEITEEFEDDLATRMEKHKNVLEGLAK